jgi:hypothetical protein
MLADLRKADRLTFSPPKLLPFLSSEIFMFICVHPRLHLSFFLSAFLFSNSYPPTSDLRSLPSFTIPAGAEAIFQVERALL